MTPPLTFDGHFEPSLAPPTQVPPSSHCSGLCTTPSPHTGAEEPCVFVAVGVAVDAGVLVNVAVGVFVGAAGVVGVLVGGTAVLVGVLVLRAVVFVGVLVFTAVVLVGVLVLIAVVFVGVLVKAGVLVGVLTAVVLVTVGVAAEQPSGKFRMLAMTCVSSAALILLSPSWLPLTQALGEAAQPLTLPLQFRIRLIMVIRSIMFA